MHSVTLPVSDVTLAKVAINRLDVRASVQSLLRRRIEAMAVDDDRLVVCKDSHPFAQAAHDAFYDHCPLVITPDDIWFCLAQGFAHHVNLNAESLRHHFVRHAGKLKLEVTRQDFVLGRPNPWPEVFTAFSDQIADHVGRPLRDLVVADFSTTTVFHRAATEVALMDAFQPYFEYEMTAGCGIPAITLKGAPDDWRDVRRRAAALAPYGLQRWVDALLPVLDQIEASSRGHQNREFWNSFFRYRSGSGGNAMTGWIQVLFPYIEVERGKVGPNPYVDTWAVDYRRASESRHKDSRRYHEEIQGPYLLQIPSGVASAPVGVIDGHTGERLNMRFVAGMFGVAQDPATLALSTSFGWAVAYDEVLPPVATSRWTRPGRLAMD
jgi:hypothetical protein